MYWYEVMDMELKPISGRVGYIPHSTNIGVIRSRLSSAVLVDTGLDGDTGKKVLRLLKENGLSLKAIVNTHSHADHCGGNQILQEEGGAVVYASEGEAAIIQYPALEPIYLFSGASPISELENKFLMAPPSRVDHVVKAGEKIVVDEIEMKMVALPGHSPNHIGIEVDGVLFCGDAVFSQEVLDKHKIPFYTDIGKQKGTLIFLEGFQGTVVPSHARPAQNISGLARLTLGRIEEIEGFVLDRLGTGKHAAQILKELCDHFGIEVKNAQEYHLMNTITLAYLSSLCKEGKAGVRVSDNALLWEKTLG